MARLDSPGFLVCIFIYFVFICLLYVGTDMPQLSEKILIEQLQLFTMFFKILIIISININKIKKLDSFVVEVVAKQHSRHVPQTS